ncbi:MAG TPA: YceD family protein, partial [Usitatibacter sp.]|nr:YceD family protein [Usitatibacter sp.]
WEGTFSPGELERLEDSLAGPEGELRYRLTAQLDRQRRKVVSCIINGFVFLTCQSSLEDFRHEVSISDRLVLVTSEAELPPIEEESDAEDYLVADEPLDIRDLVEDAVLLSLPMVPRKPGLGEAPGGREGASGEPSPFAALAQLKRKTT